MNAPAQLGVESWYEVALRIAATAERCPSCGHETRFHSCGKCWYCEATGTVTRMLLCRCGQA